MVEELDDLQLSEGSYNERTTKRTSPGMLESSDSF